MPELKASLDTIRRAASEMISSIDEKLEVLMNQKVQEQAVEKPESVADDKTDRKEQLQELLKSTAEQLSPDAKRKEEKTKKTSISMMLSEMASGSSVRFNELSQNIKDAEKRLGEIAVLRTHIINYAKTRDVYVAYRKSGYSKKFYEAHREEITLHKAAKDTFSTLSDKKIPRQICRSEIIEIGAVIMDENFMILGEFKTLVKPFKPLRFI